MNEKEILLSRVNDLKEKAADNSMITFTNFLSVDERSSLKIAEKLNNKYVDTFYYGGFTDAERTVAVFVPEFYETDDISAYFTDNPDENPLSLIEVKKDRFTEMSHRDYLGSLMALGIKRETLGDIIVTDKGAYIVSLKSMAGYICNNLKRTGRGSVACSLVDFSCLPSGDDNGKEMFCSVASMRLDCVVAAAFLVSRSLAAEAISKGLVYVDSVQILKNDYLLSEKSKIVFRGKGKAVISEESGKSKKGRTHLLIKRYK